MTLFVYVVVLRRFVLLHFFPGWGVGVLFRCLESSFLGGFPLTWTKKMLQPLGVASLEVSIFNTLPIVQRR